MVSVSGTRGQKRSHLTSFKVTVCVGDVRTEHNLVKERARILPGTMYLKLCLDLCQYSLQKRRSRSPMGAIEYKDTNRICSTRNERFRPSCSV